MIAGVVTSMGALAAALGLSWLWRLSSLSSGVRLPLDPRRIFRRGYPSIGAVCAALVIWPTALVLNSPDHLGTLIDQMHCGVMSLGNAERTIADLRKMPRFREEPFLEVMEAVIEARRSKATWGEPEHQEFLNSFTIKGCEDHPECLAWNAVLTGYSHYRVRNYGEAEKLQRGVLDDPDTHPFFKYYALKELGRIEWVVRENPDAAYECWREAAEWWRTRGPLENIAIYYQIKDDFAAAESHFEQALNEIKRYAEEGPCAIRSPYEEKAAFYVNRANFYRVWANSPYEAGRRVELLEKCKADLESARTSDPGYLDSYFTGAHIAIALGDYDEAQQMINEGRRVLSSPDEHRLDRYNHLGYRKYGWSYFEWIELRLLFKSGKTPEEVRALRAGDNTALIGLKANPRETIANLLEKVKGYGYAVDDDERELKEMCNAGFLEALVE